MLDHLTKRKDMRPLNRKESILQHRADMQARIDERTPIKPDSFDAKAIIERLRRK